MGDLGQDFQILDAVIALVAVAVVDFLAWLQVATKMLLHDQTVLIYKAALGCKRVVGDIAAQVATAIGFDCVARVSLAPQVMTLQEVEGLTLKHPQVGNGLPRHPRGIATTAITQPNKLLAQLARDTAWHNPFLSWRKYTTLQPTYVQAVL